MWYFFGKNIEIESCVKIMRKNENFVNPNLQFKRDFFLSSINKMTDLHSSLRKVSKILELT